MRLLEELRAALGPDAVRTAPAERMSYSYDATGEKHLPDAVLMLSSTQQVATALRIAAAHGTPVVARGAGTNLSGGTLPTHGGLVFNLLQMNRVLSIDTERRRADVEPGVVNLTLNRVLQPLGFHFAPDPSSGKVSTVGGNIAENAGGPHCLKYGVTTGHVLAVELATADGKLIELTGEDGYDLRALVVGSEGTLGIVTRATVRITPLPRAARTLLATFDDLDRACQTVSRIIAAQIIPAALELMDRANLEITRSSGIYPFPEGAEAALIIEVDGDPEDLGEEAEAISGICREMGAVAIEAAETEEQRARLWYARKANYGIQAQTSPYIWAQDVTVPRPRLPEMLREVVAIGKRLGVRIMTVAHAGDGNLHPAMPFDPHDPDERARVRQADLEILAACVRLGGSISGEHGIGIDKLPGMDLMFRPHELRLMESVRRVFDPDGRMNPGKLLPVPKGGW